MMNKLVAVGFLGMVAVASAQMAELACMMAKDKAACASCVQSAGMDQQKIAKCVESTIDTSGGGLPSGGGSPSIPGGDMSALACMMAKDKAACESCVKSAGTDQQKIAKCVEGTIDTSGGGLPSVPGFSMPTLPDLNKACTKCDTNHGKCLWGKCSCHRGYSGFDCSTKATATPMACKEVQMMECVKPFQAECQKFEEGPSSGGGADITPGDMGDMSALACMMASDKAACESCIKNAGTDAAKIQKCIGTPSAGGGGATPGDMSGLACMMASDKAACESCVKNAGTDATKIQQCIGNPGGRRLLQDLSMACMMAADKTACAACVQAAGQDPTKIQACVTAGGAGGLPDMGDISSQACMLAKDKAKCAACIEAAGQDTTKIQACVADTADLPNPGTIPGDGQIPDMSTQACMLAKDKEKCAACVKAAGQDPTKIQACVAADLPPSVTPPTVTPGSGDDSSDSGSNSGSDGGRKMKPLTCGCAAKLMDCLARFGDCKDFADTPIQPGCNTKKPVSAKKKKFVVKFGKAASGINSSKLGELLAKMLGVDIKRIKVLTTSITGAKNEPVEVELEPASSDAEITVEAAMQNLELAVAADDTLTWDKQSTDVTVLVCPDGVVRESCTSGNDNSAHTAAPSFLVALFAMALLALRQ